MFPREHSKGTMKLGLFRWCVRKSRSVNNIIGYKKLYLRDLPHGESNPDPQGENLVS